MHIRKILAKVRKDLRGASIMYSNDRVSQKRAVNRSGRQNYSSASGQPPTLPTYANI